jgi:pimeloyl-ACP methyl ester carboxylesterase
MTTLGMDTEAGLAASGELDQGSQKIAELATRLDSALRSFDWTGTDAERTHDSWQQVERPALDGTVAQLAAMALLIRQEAQAQDTASGKGGGSTGSTAVATPRSAQPQGFLGKVGDFIGRRIDAAFTGVERTLGHAGDFLGKVGDVLTGQESHSVSEIAASAIGALGSGVGTVVDAIDGTDSNWFGDGAAVADPPLAVGEGGRPPLTQPTDMASLMQGVTDAYTAGGTMDGGDVRITQVDNGNGPAYVVHIPGTETWSPSAGTEPRDLSANINLVAGNPTAAAESVRLAMDAAGIPPGSPVMLVGHSQGGIIAGQLASDPAFVQQYGVTNVLTYGAPIDHMQLAPGVDALQVQHRFDVVPRLDLGGVDLGGTNPNNPVTAVTLDSPGGLFGVVTNHDHTAYSNSVREAMAGDTEAGRILRDYQSQLAPFLVTPTGTATGIDVPVRRRPE